MTADAATLKGAALFGTAIEVPVREFVSLDVQGGKATNLADLKPKTESVEPYNDLAWPWQANRTVKHRPRKLSSKLGVSTFDGGLGAHPKTTLTYSLDGKFIRQYNRDEIPGQSFGSGAPNQIIPDIEWDLKNSKGIPVSAGVYLVHVNAGEKGERTLKWFGITRQYDPTGL